MIVTKYEAWMRAMVGRPAVPWLMDGRSAGPPVSRWLFAAWIQRDGADGASIIALQTRRQVVAKAVRCGHGTLVSALIATVTLPKAPVPIASGLTYELTVKPKRP